MEDGFLNCVCSNGSYENTRSCQHAAGEAQITASYWLGENAKITGNLCFLSQLSHLALPPDATVLDHQERLGLLSLIS